MLWVYVKKSLEGKEERGGGKRRKFLEFRVYEVASETILGPKRCFSEARRQSFTRMNTYPFCSLCHIALVSVFRLFANLTSHTLRRSFGWKNRKLLEDSVFRTVRSHLVLCCNMSPCCVRAMGICRAFTVFGDVKQVMGEGKSGPVETGLTGPVATALYGMCILTWCVMLLM